MDKKEEQCYLQGSQQAWRMMLGTCLRQLGCEDTSAGQARWVAERTDVILLLRSLCAEYGDNDWPDNLHISDILGKHIYWYKFEELKGQER